MSDPDTIPSVLPSIDAPRARPVPDAAGNRWTLGKLALLAVAAALLLVWLARH